MRRFLFVVVSVFILIGAAPTLATPVADLTGLARYFPAHTPVFAVLQTDDNFIQALDRIMNSVISKLSPELVPQNIPLPSALFDLAATQLTGSDFDTSIRPWLGSNAAIGITSSESLMSGRSTVLAVISINDRVAAEAFLNRILSPGLWEATTVGSFTLFEPTSQSLATIAIGDEVVFITNEPGALPIGDVQGGTLADDAGFNQTLGLLPASDYSFLVYSNTGELIRPFVATSNNNPIYGLDPASFPDLIGAQAIGFTLLDNRSLVLDAVANVGDLSTLENAGFDTYVGGPIHPDFATHIPVNASLALHLNNAQALYNSLVQNARLTETTPGQTDQGLDSARSTIQNLTGLDLESDILSWMTGDYSLFVSIDSEAIQNWNMEILLTDPWVVDEKLRQRFVEEGFDVSSVERPIPALETLPIGFGVVIEAMEPVKAAAFAEALGNALPLLANQNPDIQVSQEQMGGVNVTVVSQPLRYGSLTLPLEVIVGANDQVFTVATRQEAASILGGGTGINTEPSFVEATGYFLGGSSSVVYVDIRDVVSPLFVVLSGPAIGNIFIMCNDQLSEDCIEQQRQARQEQLTVITEANERSRQLLPAFYQSINSIFSSSSISTASTENGDAVIRFVVTLEE